MPIYHGTSHAYPPIIVEVSGQPQDLLVELRMHVFDVVNVGSILLVGLDSGLWGCGCGDTQEKEHMLT